MIVPNDPADERNFLERFVTSPAAIATILIAILGQAAVSIVYQIVNNEQQEAKIRAATEETKYLREQVFNMQTPLSQKVLKSEDKIDSLRLAHDELTKRLDQIDTAGTRALALVTANQQRVMSQVDRLGDRLLMQDRKLSELDAKSSSPGLQARIEEIVRNETRLEDQQRRIIEALDNLYSQVSKILPVLRQDKK